MKDFLKSKLPPGRNLKIIPVPSTSTDSSYATPFTPNYFTPINILLTFATRYKTKKDEGDYHRRYGREHLENIEERLEGPALEEEEEEEETIDATDSELRSQSPELNVPPYPYNEQLDTSVESSNIIHIFTSKRGKNAH